MSTTTNDPARGFVWPFLVCILVFMSACASSRNSAQKITEAEGTIQQVSNLGATEYATTELTSAKQKLEEARRFAEQGKQKKAIMKAEEAMADANLAESRTLSEKAKKELSDLQANIQSIRDKIEQTKQEQE